MLRPTRARGVDHYLIDHCLIDQCLIDHGRRNAVLAGFLLHIGKFPLSVFDSLLLVGDLLLVIRVLLIPLGFVAHAISRVGVHGGGTKLIFALQHVQLAGGQVNLILLCG